MTPIFITYIGTQNSAMINMMSDYRMVVKEQLLRVTIIHDTLDKLLILSALKYRSDVNFTLFLVYYRVGRICNAFKLGNSPCLRKHSYDLSKTEKITFKASMETIKLPVIAKI